MKRIILTLSIALSMTLATSIPFLNPSSISFAASGTAQQFINDARWRNGVSWGASKGPEISAWPSSGCAAYAADFAKYVYDKDDPRSGTPFGNAREIRSGDIIEIPGHWFVVISRNGDSLYTAEGNFSGVVRVATNVYTVSGNTLYDKYNGAKTVVNGYHYTESVGIISSGSDTIIQKTKDGLWLYGWAFDQKNPYTPVTLTVVIGGPFGTAGADQHSLGQTDVYRSEINNGIGTTGFNKTIHTPFTGDQPVYLYGEINGKRELLGYKTVNVGSLPIGKVESVESRCAGTIMIKGWALDYDYEGYSSNVGVVIGPSGNQETVMVDVNRNTLLAGKYRPDVNNDFGGTIGDYHGFNYFIPTTKTGTQNINIYGLNIGNGYDVSIGQKTVTISAEPHSFNNGKVIRAATTSSAGSMEETCSKCGKTETVTIPQIAGMTLGSVSYTYDGTEKKPSVTVKDSGGTTIPSSNYSVAYKNNVNPGTATATVTFTGSKYSGELSATFVIKEIVPAEMYIVTFVDGHGHTLKTETVEKGKSATAPTNPTKDGYTFDGWDNDFSNITANLTVTAKWKEKATPATEPTPEPGSDPNQIGNDGTAVGRGASAVVAEKAIMNMATDSDPKGTVFSELTVRSPKQTNTSISLKWTRVSNASKYVIYGNKCGKNNKMKKLAASTGKSKTIKKVAGKKLKKGKYYKFIIVALDKNNNVVSTSKIIHVATKGGKVGNHKNVTVKKSVIAKAKKLKKGKSLRLNAKAVKASKLKVEKHRALCYESSNSKIATVSKKGVVKGKKKGTCYIYAYAQNGVYKKIKVKVK